MLAWFVDAYSDVAEGTERCQCKREKVSNAKKNNSEWWIWSYLRFVSWSLGGYEELVMD
jgi:hypothetical protein